MKWEEPTNARLENFRCNFRWANSNTLLVGWVNTIRICALSRRNSVEATLKALPGFISLYFKQIPNEVVWSTFAGHITGIKTWIVTSIYMTEGREPTANRNVFTNVGRKQFADALPY
ncbi:uncharacterized protein ACN2A1_012963 [Glossina fuscipes fuscipes]